MIIFNAHVRITALIVGQALPDVNPSIRVSRLEVEAYSYVLGYRR